VLTKNKTKKKEWRDRPQQGSQWCKVQGGLKKCQKYLQQSVRKENNQVESKIREVSQKIHLLQMADDEVNVEEENKLQSELYSLLEQEELKWKQRAREDCLKFGYRNTKFFHAYANHKNRKKQISKVVDKDGRICSTQDEIEEAFNVYFKDLFTAGSNLEIE